MACKGGNTQHPPQYKHWPENALKQKLVRVPSCAAAVIFVHEQGTERALHSREKSTTVLCSTG